MTQDEKPKRRKDQRPDEIIQAAMEVFAECGFANAKIVDIAKRAGAAKGTVYRYFETKDELFEAVVHHYVSPMFAQIEKRVSFFPGSTTDLLTSVLERVYEQIVNNHERWAIMRILIAEGARFPKLTEFYHREVLAGAQRLMGSIIKRGIDSGEFRDTLAQQYPGVIVGPMLMSAIWKMTFDEIAPLDIKEFAKAHIDLVLNGLRHRPEEEPQASPKD